jgi:6-pyruvoyltetrahydropterin/6-carboxytetrahydropterin synthase
MPLLELNVTFNFSSSHFLTEYHGKCETLHGHNYKLIVTIKGPIKNDGLVMDYKIIKETVNEKVIEKLDHKHLNDIVENPSSENIVLWVWNKLKNDLPLKKLRLFETENYYCDYEGK